MLGSLLKFELSLHIRQVGFWITCAILFGIGLLASSTDFINVFAQGGAKLKSNGAMPLSTAIGIWSFLAIFFCAVFTVTGVMRDDNHKMVELIHSTPIKTSDMVISRMIGVWVVCFLCIFAAVIGMMAGGFMSWTDKETFQAFNLWHYLQPTIFYVVINSLVVSSLFIFVAAVTRDKALVYVSAVGIFALNMAVGFVMGQDPAELPATLLDPFGVNGATFDTEFWSAAEQNSQTVPLLGYFGLNRLVWTVIALGLLALSYFQFERGIVTRKTKRKAEDFAQETGKISVMPVTPKAGLGAQWQAFFTRFKFEYMLTVKSVSFAVLSTIAIAIFGMMAYSMLFLSPDPTLATSRAMANMSIGSFGFTLVIVMIFFGSDIIWRDRTIGVHEILDSTPVQNGVFMAAKWAALLAVVYTLIAISLLAAMITQPFVGDIPINFATYAKLGFVSFGVSFIFSVIMVMFIQNFAPNRIVGMLLAAGVLIGLLAMTGLPFYHPMMSYGIVSPGSYSEISGYGNLLSFKWGLIYWGGLALFMAVLSVWLWRRGLQTSLMSRLRGIKDRIGPMTGGLAVLGLLCFFGGGAVWFKAFNIDQEFRFKKARELRTVNYEKMVTPYLDIAVPKIRSVETMVDVFPSRREAVFSGQYVIENTTGEPLQTLFVDMASSHEEDRLVLSIKRATPDLTSDEAVTLETHGVRRFNFDPPLAAGETTTMAFETFFHAPRLADGSIIRKNGTFVNNFVVFPQLGIPENFMRNPDKRRKYDLGERKRSADRDDMEARMGHYIGKHADYVDFSAQFCTDKGQIPIAPGKMVREYEKDGRACRDYRAVNPILNFFSFLSADYAVAQDVWTDASGKDIDLAIYYHADHGYNIDLMMDAIKKGLEIFSRDYGPYQYAQVRIMEFPSGGFAQAFAGTIPFSENIGFMRDPGDPDDQDSIDIATYVTLHEMAHQWFAHQIVSANTKGNTILTEGLSEHSAMLAYEEIYGWQKARLMLDKRAIQTYLITRTVDKDKEPVLAEAESEQYVHYNKAAWVFWGLRHYIGVDTLQTALRKFVEDYGSKGPPYPTTLQLIEYLREAAGPDYDQLITDYFDRITFWDLGYGEDDPVMTTLDNGKTKVDFTVTIDKKIASSKDGKETSVTEIDGEVLSEWVEIGFYDTDPKETLGGDWTALERVRITETQTPLSFTLDAPPNFIVLDPRRLLIERVEKDNTVDLSKDNADAKKAASGSL